jgi:hypothetical protein
MLMWKGRIALQSSDVFVAAAPSPASAGVMLNANGSIIIATRTVILLDILIAFIEFIFRFPVFLILVTT